MKDRRSGVGSNSEFGAPWGLALKAISVGVTLFLLALAGGAIAFRNLDQLGRILLTVLPILALGLCGLFVIRGYSLHGQTLLIQRPFWTTSIDLRALQSVRFEPRAMRGSIRVFGNGGLFSFTGFYWNRNLGMYRSWVNDFHRSVVLRFPQRNIVISPDDPQRFTACLGSGETN